MRFGIIHSGWNYNIKAIFALAHMLPPPANQRNKSKCADIENKIFVFKPVRIIIDNLKSLTFNKHISAQHSTTRNNSGRGNQSTISGSTRL